MVYITNDAKEHEVKLMRTRLVCTPQNQARHWRAQSGDAHQNTKSAHTQYEFGLRLGSQNSRLLLLPSYSDIFICTIWCRLLLNLESVAKVNVLKSWSEASLKCVNGSIRIGGPVPVGSIPCLVCCSELHPDAIN
jgi:hypothetical protein